MKRTGSWLSADAFMNSGYCFMARFADQLGAVSSSVDWLVHQCIQWHGVEWYDVSKLCKRGSGIESKVGHVAGETANHFMH